MGKLLNTLTKQIKTEEFKQDAESCLKIYNKLKELNDGSVWSNQWSILTSVKFVGKMPNSVKVYKPSEIGEIFIKGL